MFRPALGTTTLFGLAAGAALAGLASCSESARPAPSPSDTPVASSDAADAALRAIRAHLPADRSLDERGLAALVPTTEGGLRAVALAADAPAVELPAEASGAVHVHDEGSGVAVSFTLVGARSVPVAVSSGFAVYAAAAPSGGDIVHRVFSAGTEDFVFYARRPEQERLRYRVDVSRVPGLRLVERTLEMLDASGTPRLRVAPPALIDAAGRQIQADLSLEGCAADRRASAPWGRAVTGPGESACQVVVSWSGRGVRYPAMIDPAWVSTKTMTVERSHHAVAALPNPAAPPADTSPSLITGGFDKNDQPLASAELYEPLSRTFAATGSMIKPRAAHSSTPLTASPIGHVVIAGGAGMMLDKSPPTRLAFATLADGATTETYNPQTGTFTIGPSMAAPRFRHSAVALDDGRVLLAGGITDLVNQPTKSADLFSFDGALFTGTITPAGQLVAARYAHAAARLANGDVLITGGVGSASFSLLSGEVYSASASAFTQAPGLMTAGRAFHTAVTLTSGEVLIAGGVNAVSPPISYIPTADRFTGGTFALSAVPMTTGRAFHTATRLSPMSLLPPVALPSVEPAEVILAGGFDGSADLASADVYFPGSNKIAALSVPMSTTRRHAVAVLASAGAFNAGALVGRGVAVIGGISGSKTITGNLVNGQATRTAEVLLKNLGERCAAGGECLSGHCADQVCCNASCDQECFSCTSALKGAGLDGICGPTEEGFPLPVFCYDDSGSQDHVEVHNECDGAGNAQPGPGTKSCKPATCATNGLCSTGCTTTADCAVTGWCDTSDPSGGVCKDKKAPGADCGGGDECFSTFCVDTVCCNTACSGQCQACNLADLGGTCSPVGSVEDKGQPHPNTLGAAPRALCEGQGTACMGFCSKTDLTSCTYPDETVPLQADDCVDQDDGKPSKLTIYRCDEKGGSTTDATGDCGGLRCADAHACRTTCASDDDCIQDHVCIAGDAGTPTCVKLDGPLCDGDKTLRRPVADGGDVVCADHYACPAGAKACLTECASVSDCVDGLVCNAKHECVETLEAPELPSCSTSPTPRRGGAPLAAIAALFGLAALAARRRSR